MTTPGINPQADFLAVARQLILEFKILENQFQVIAQKSTEISDSLKRIEAKTR